MEDLHLKAIVKDVIKGYLSGSEKLTKNEPGAMKPDDSVGGRRHPETGKETDGAHDKKAISRCDEASERVSYQDRLRDRASSNEAILARWLRNQEPPKLRFRQPVPPDPAKALRGGVAEMPGHQPRYELIPNPKKPGLLDRLLRRSSARLGVWRAGSRPKTKVALDFLADHAIAKEAVYYEFETEKAKRLGLLEIHSKVKNKEEFLLRPDLGRELSPDSKTLIETQCKKGIDVQIVVSDGLSGLSLHENIEKLLPRLISHFESKGMSVGTPLYCRFARVLLQDRIGEITSAKVNIILIGERPGLGTGDSLSGYLIFRPNANSTHANRNCISNIHPRGLVLEEAINTIDFAVGRMIQQSVSGVSLDLT